jgi:transcriptional regulator GlxA family with amidase domain
VGVLDGLLRDRLCGCLRGVDERVLVASDLVSATAGRVTVDGLAKASGLGRRQLERRFLAVVGTPPKVAVRVARFRAAVMRMHRQPGSSLSLVAAETGYADQAHFTREFKALAGTSPGRYREGIG